MIFIYIAHRLPMSRVHSEFVTIRTVARKKNEKQGGKVLVSFFLHNSLLEAKSLSLLKFFCCLGVYLKLCQSLKLI
jgi:hypothetical protein